jgi:hypothetical protein
MEDAHAPPPWSLYIHFTLVYYIVNYSPGPDQERGLTPN